jgi:flagella basal body P-ring formation protein FlgA
LTSIFISTLLWTTVALAEQPSAPAISAIEALAKDVVAKKVNAPASARVNITPQPLDSRVAIPRCSSPITAVLASDREISRNNTVRISCDSPDFSYPVVVAKETLAPGDVLSTAQMEIRYVDQYSVNGEQFSDMQQLIGTRLKRRVSKDYPIFGSNICVVCKGDTVSIIARTEQFQIKTVGEAVEDGNLGQQIRVKNTRSNKTVDAIVTHVGEVQVKM